MVRKSKKKSVTPPDSPTPNTPSTGSLKDTIDSVEQAIVELREQGKNQNDVDYNKRLREILDAMDEGLGRPKRPITAAPPSKSVQYEDTDEEEDEEEEEEEEDDVKKLVNTRLTTCMMLALLVNDHDEESKEFFKKMKERDDLEEVLEKFTRDEFKCLNNLLKKYSETAKRRVRKAR